MATGCVRLIDSALHDSMQDITQPIDGLSTDRATGRSVGRRTDRPIDLPVCRLTARPDDRPVGGPIHRQSAGWPTDPPTNLPVCSPPSNRSEDQPVGQPSERLTNPTGRSDIDYGPPFRCCKRSYRRDLSLTFLSQLRGPCGDCVNVLTIQPFCTQRLNFVEKSS